MDYEHAVEAVVTWAKGQPNVRAVVLTGSAADLSQHPLSDRDIELHVRETEPLELDDSWWEELGEVLAVERLENAEEQPTRLIYYVGGKLDFTLIDATSRENDYERPYSVLLDKDGATSEFSVVAPPAQMPDQNSFDECCNWAAAAALMTAKAIARDEPWSVVTRDYDLKTELLRMIEWDHNLRYRGTRDVRYLGTRMRNWMDPAVQTALEHCWGPFGHDNTRPLLAAISLFDDTATRVAHESEIESFDLTAVREEVDRILSTAEGAEMGPDAT
ncbi:aminoglycoside 6-adenylyltransferase [Dietzia timorensis]|uniref:Streptomycin resistance protein n=1 Tax=Dietzia timorensis TaxID=499555 RepID=A0A173LH16_9ACTN|nr:aminoglycoside 6-adenylyltransferase [Dietzia timorensis]ANI90884.1 Streptomycin resistance protein [Dietzia timorensis]